MMLGQSTGWVDTNPGCLLVWDDLRSPANFIFCMVSKIGHDSGPPFSALRKEGF